MSCPKELECKNGLIIYRCKNIHFTISKFTKQFSKRGMGNTMGHSTDLFTEPHVAVNYMNFTLSVAG